MNKRLFSIVALLALAAAVALSCAREEDESEDSIQKRILDAYVLTNCPGAHVSQTGLVILNKEEGTGPKAIQKRWGAYISYSKQGLDGVYAEYNMGEIATMLGQYSKTEYYGPTLYLFGVGNTIQGLEETLIGMREGGRATVIIPPWLSGYETVNINGIVQSNGQRVNAVNFIYDLKVGKVIDSIVRFEIDTLESYRDRFYPGVDSVAQGFYFKRLKTVEGDTIKSEESVNVWYVGRLLDGFVFDTNIADTAKKYGIYSSSGTYTALSVTYGDTYATMAESNSLVSGFTRALKKMRYGEEGVTFFSSDFGYGYQGSGTIGMYQPLCFYLKLEDEE
ncbi:MAG: FKBP-type peptidyl-prolyl cis-trans isomerase [Candidatus Egerieousia sp.]|nr:FKBP-type peptidyl-prolyl cis-trans isomerase [bacterium]MDY2650581.1 FKBP-type peptidyl-prolyl cis-trans isomerase [Candidatus Egerieousia sp.]MDD7236248.1 FKBP-type peptidyl-prolyl cis-trans isomerase [bacterium]MDY3293952.1 FKBP-type peptidyl-prolyl cis-trans isomerase [Candidatus Egerieousia sp.]MDY5255660.1 FKBP-type peptidyl-prolyl cis-trans isomerase [Candidatus Egerieousia sp.]